MWSSVKKILSVISLIFLINLTGCSAKDEATEVSKLPEIVFLDITRHRSTDGSTTYCFLDRNGDFYVSKDQYLYTLTFQMLIEQYAEGKLEDKVEYLFSCDTEEILSNYNVLKNIDKDSVSFYEPDYYPSMITDVRSWYGFYYDKNNEIRYMMIHKEDNLGHHDADNEEINEIYQWYSSLVVNKNVETEDVADGSEAIVEEDSVIEGSVKEPALEDIDYDKETGIQYVKNQLLISAHIGTEKHLVEELVNEVGAEIVGYIALTDDYQIEFAEEKTIEELTIIADYINSFSFVSDVSLNVASVQDNES